MNLKDLKYIVSVAETKHFGKAAEHCFVSQPTLSGQIKKVEDELGIAIFERTNRSVEITPIGHEIITLARSVLEQSNAIKLLAKSHQDPLVGPLKVGALPTLSPYLMPFILVPLKRRHPQLKLVLYEEMTHVLLQRLHDHEIDAALLASPVDEPDLIVEPLFDEPFWLAHPRQHWLYNRDTITETDLSKTELLLLAEGHCLAQQAMEVCRLADQQPQQGEMADLRAASLETLLQLVSAGFGSTLVPALALRGSWVTDSGIVARKLEIPNAYRQVTLAYRPSFPRKQALQALKQIIIEHLPNTVYKITD